MVCIFFLCWSFSILLVVLVLGNHCASGFQVKEVAPEARRRDAMLSFAFVYPTKTGHFTVKEVISLALLNFTIEMHHACCSKLVICRILYMIVDYFK